MRMSKTEPYQALGRSRPREYHALGALTPDVVQQPEHTRADAIAQRAKCLAVI